MFKWFTRFTDARSERHDFQFGELVSFNSEYDCLHLVLPIAPRRVSERASASGSALAPRPGVPSPGEGLAR